MNFTCVYVKTRRKLDKFFKVNKIKNKYIIDIKKMMDDEGVEPGGDKLFLKVLIMDKVRQGIEKDKDIYYIPNFDDEFSISKLLNIKKILDDNYFNILLFHDEFDVTSELIDEAFDHLSYFDNSQIIRDY